MKRLMNNEEFQRQADYYSRFRYKCKCGHTVIIPVFIDKVLCDWCGNFVFKDKKTEFKYRIKEKIK